MKSGFKGLVLASTVGLGAALISGCNSEEAPPASPPPTAPAAKAGPAPAPSKEAAPAPKAGEEKKDAPKAEAPAKKEG